jgi:tRNA (guanine10-N2)-dimethyltransferase
MAGNIACLRGWHPALAKAELSALFPNNEMISLNSQRFVEISGKLDIEKIADIIQYSSGTQAILLDCVVMNWNEESSLEDFISQVSNKIENSDKNGTFGVIHWRQEGKIKDLSGSKLAGMIGGIAGKKGFKIDLDKPDNKLGLVLDGSSNQVICGWLIDYESIEGNSNTRRATERPFFKPISLDPKLARLAVNLAVGPLDEYAVLDPMTGTGGFVIEAALIGRNAIALDLEQDMVNGAMKNVLWALDNEEITTAEHIQIIRGDATDLANSIPRKWHQKISGLVLDPPYGRNSHGSLSHFDLIRNTLISYRDVASEDATIVLILPIKPPQVKKLELQSDSDEIILLHGEWDEFKQLLSECNWRIEGLWVEHVHSSLGRLILHASNVPLN